MTITKSTRWESSQGIRINKEITRLEKLFEDFNCDTKDYKSSTNWGYPVGKEVW
jgi:hypothetical protein